MWCAHLRNESNPQISFFLAHSNYNNSSAEEGEEQQSNTCRGISLEYRNKKSISHPKVYTNLFHISAYKTAKLKQEIR